MAGGKFAKAKGDRFERECVNFLNSAGIPASRVPLSGSLGGEYSDDLRVEVAGLRRNVECKSRKSGFGTLYGWLGSCYALFTKDDRCEPLVVMRLADWRVLVQEARRLPASPDAHPTRIDVA